MIYPILENQDFGPGYILFPKRGVLFQKHVWLASGFSDKLLVCVAYCSGCSVDCSQLRHPLTGWSSLKLWSCADLIWSKPWSDDPFEFVGTAPEELYHSRFKVPQHACQHPRCLSVCFPRWRYRFNLVFDLILMDSKDSNADLPQLAWTQIGIFKKLNE